jgi:predicted membrane-bound dolichyl-phosphate-mannose-protein mannosyltransferase
MSRTASSIATFLLAFENLFFMLSSLAMQDVFCLTFMMAAFLLYANRRYINTGIAVGLGALAKLNGALAGPVVFVHWLFDRMRDRKFMLTIIFTLVTFLALMPLGDFFIVRKISSYLDPISRILTMLTLSGGLTFAFVDHPYEAPPWEWLYTYNPMPFNYMPHYTAAISFTVWALIIPIFIYMIWRAVKKDNAGLFGVSWFTVTYLFWIPATLITDRVTYIYYFYPAVGAICLGLGMALGQLIDIFRTRPSGKLKWFALSVVIFILVLHVLSFLILSPLIPVDFAKLVGLS